MFTSITELISCFKSESESTIKIFSALTDQSLNQKVYAEGRTLGYLAWHIVLTLGEMAGKLGIKVDCPEEDTPEPNVTSEIIDTYKTASQSILNSISSWNDSDLLIEDNMYGEVWKRGYSFYGLLNHQTHHRAQITVLMRQAGLKVPGVYGPAKEEWEMYGMATQK